MGQCHEIFDFWFCSWISFCQASDTWQMEKIFKQKILIILFGHLWVVQGASKIKFEKVNKKRTVRVRRVIIFLNISRHPLLIWLHCCFHQYKTLKAVAMAKAAIVLLTPARNFNKVFWGFLVVFPLFNHFLGYVEIYQRVIWPKKIDFETFERL